MKQLIKISIVVFISMIFTVGSTLAQEHSESGKSNQPMMKDGTTMHDSTMMKNHDKMMQGKTGMMKNHKGMMKDGGMKCDSTMMKNHKGMMKNHKGMMKDGGMKCDSTMMKNHKGMMKNHKGMMKDGGMMNHGAMMKNKSKMMGSDIVHKGIIDVKSIDINNDGKVYQDVMDWNVISDKPGKDPNCGMELKEVSVNEATKNLKDHGYRVK